jgi:hypothetical protein
MGNLKRLIAAGTGALLVALSGCAVISPRLPIPLPTDGIELTGAVAGAAGSDWDVDYSPRYSLAFAGGGIAAQVFSYERFSIEVDGAAGGGLLEGRTGGPRLGLSSGARAWWQQETTAIGIDVNGTGAVSLPEARGRWVHQALQAEFRALGAWHCAENIWLATRPGVVLAWNNNDAGVLPLLDLPIAWAWASGPLRLGLEVGLIGPLIPSSVHGGLSAGYVF